MLYGQYGQVLYGYRMVWYRMVHGIVQYPVNGMGDKF